MQNIKKTLRLLGLTLLIVLATIGVGIGGGVFIAPNKKREEANIKIELVERKKNDAEIEEVKDVKQ